ncbi:MAG: hypothetical protein ACYCX4_01735 [Bacillota bacterium]
MNDEAAKQVMALVSRAEREKFFGTLTFQFRAGKLVMINKNQTILPAEGKTEEPREG